ELGGPPLADLGVVALELGLAARAVADEWRSEGAALIRPREEPRGRLAEVIADDQVADPADRDAQGERRGERVGDLEEPQPEPPDVDRVRHRRSRDPAQQRDAALPYLQPADRRGEV